jgi:hypothetical protein
MSTIYQIINNILNSSLENKFKGYDPYDGLFLNNSFGKKINKNKFFRLILIHFHKRSIFNFRAFFGIKPGLNPKTLALFLSGLIKLDKIEDPTFIVDLIKEHQSVHTSKTAWGYYFDWQSRVFFQPKDTPTIVATSFVINSLLDLYEINRSSKILKLVESSIQFITEDLNIYEDENGICFSYSPLDKSIIYNASALGLEVISRYLKITGKPVSKLNLLLEKGVNFLKVEQNSDGSWFYGKKPIQHFIDHYHTAYILESLENIDKYTNQEYNLKLVIEKGLDFFINNMFTKEAAPKYFKNAVYPIESHSSGAAIKALCVLSERHGNYLFELAVKVSKWTIDNLYDEKSGYFYYQKRKFWTNKINYLRWSQSWMFVGLSYLIYYGKKYDYSFD